jgi:hypothetical protein
MATRVAKILARTRVGDCLPADWFGLHFRRQRLETLIDAGPFPIRAIEDVLDKWRQWSG